MMSLMKNQQKAAAVLTQRDNFSSTF